MICAFLPEGLFIFLAGFFLWNMDNIFCQHLTATKQQLLLPWSVLLEGHGWWHVLTGLGTLAPFYCHLLFLDYTMLTLEIGGMWHLLLGNYWCSMTTKTANNTAYHMILWRVWLTRCLDGSEKDFVLDWVPLRSVPQVVPRRQPPSPSRLLPREKTQ